MDAHSGRPHILVAGDVVALLCPCGHVVSTMKAKDFPHSQEEARLSDPAYVVTCGGTISRETRAAQSGRKR